MSFGFGVPAAGGAIVHEGGCVLALRGQHWDVGGGGVEAGVAARSLRGGSQAVAPARAVLTVAVVRQSQSCAAPGGVSVGVGRAPIDCLARLVPLDG